MHIGKLFQRAANRHPNRLAIVDERFRDGRFTYREWDDIVSSLAGSLVDLGVEPGDRVGTVMRNRFELATVFWATQKIGAAFVPYNFRVSADELAFLVANAEPDVLFFSEPTTDTVRSLPAGVTDGRTLVAVDDASANARSFATVLDRGDDRVRLADIDADATSIVLHTSGTTGRPKGVPRSHENTYVATLSQAIQHRWVDGERTLGLMPLYHTMGIHTLTTMSLLCGTWVAQRSFAADRTLDLVADERLTCLYLVPTVFHDLVDEGGPGEFETVERVSYAGTPMSEAVQTSVREAIDPDEFVNHYGSTEVYLYSVCHWLDEKPSCAGRADHNTEVRVVRAERDATVPPSDTVAAGDLGEVIVDASAPTAFDGYLDRPSADEAAFRDGWFFTGDLGYVDEDGDLFVVGRVDDMIISGGENINPVEVEDTLDGSDVVREVAVVGRDDERWNQVVTAFVRPATPRSSPDEYHELAGQLDGYLADSTRLADFKRPRRYVFLDSIPKNSVGKVLRRQLQDAELSTLDVFAAVDT